MGYQEEDRKIPLEDQRWQSPEPILAYEPVRELFRPALGEVVISVFDQYVPQTGGIVEVGSGLGELVHHLVPEGSPYRKTIQQTDQGIKIIERHKQLHPGSNIRQAKVDALPYMDSSIHTVVGLTSFDNFADQTKAVKEIKRVLQVGGRVIHFLDLEASPDPLFYNYDSSSTDYIPYPTISGKHDLCNAVVQIHPSDMLKELQGFEGDQKKIPIMIALTKYATNPEEQFNILLKSGLLDPFARLIKNSVAPPGAKTITFNEYFLDRFRNALEDEGFEIEEFGLREADAIVNRQTSLSQQFPDKNIMIFEEGVTYTQHDPSLSSVVTPDKLKIIARPHVIVAKK